MRGRFRLAASAMIAFATVGSTQAGTFVFSTGNPDGEIATRSRPAGPGRIETETADDFLLTQKNPESRIGAS